MTKKIFLISVLCLLTLHLFGRTIRVATYNLGNYLVTDRMVNKRYSKMYPKPESEKEAIHKIIAIHQPDILILQEMGEDPFLKELQVDLKTLKLDYPYTYLAKGADNIRHIAVLSKEPFINATSYNQLNYKFLKNDKMPVRRGLLELQFKTKGIEWSIFGIHLKSRRWDKPQDYESVKQRVGEAIAIRDKIKERYPYPEKSNYLILGDFNDNPKSKTIKRFLKSGKQKLSIILPAKDSRGEVWTHFRQSYGVYSQIDYILASPLFLEKIKDKSASIADSIFALEASDHRMVYADIVF